MKKEIQMQKIRNYVFDRFHDDATGHDFQHMKRVAETAKYIASEENSNPFICEAAAWLHDIGDSKLFANPEQAIEEMYSFLKSLFIAGEEITQIRDAIKDVSFSKGNVPTTLEGKIVQDADRIDAIGAIGIARTFAYGGAKGQPIYHEENDNNSIQHFYDKLLKIKDLLHTSAARKLAENRHSFMEKYLDQFYKEW